MTGGSVFIRILQILLAVAFVVLCYYVVVWVLGLLGIAIPAQILTVIFVIIALVLAIGVLTGRADNIKWWCVLICLALTLPAVGCQGELKVERKVESQVVHPMVYKLYERLSKTQDDVEQLKEELRGLNADASKLKAFIAAYVAEQGRQNASGGLPPIFSAKE